MRLTGPRHRKPTKRRLPLLLLAGLALALFGCQAAPEAGRSGGKWVGTWVSAQQLVEPGNLPPPPGLRGASLRQIIQPSLDGTQLRLTFSNLFGDQPLTIAAATVAHSAGEAKIEAGDARAVSFGGQPSVTLAAGAAAVSDPVAFDVHAFENLAVTVFCDAVPKNLTGHPGSRTTSYLLAGNHVADADFPAALTTDHWYLLANADVWAAPSAAAIVVIGDSITDGRGSTTNQNDRWPNLLARRLHADPRTAAIAVLNQGIGGNRLLHPGLGPSALDRFERDALQPPGVRWVIVYEGINDVGTAAGARAKKEPAASAQDIIASFEQMIAKAKSHGLIIYGATLMPFEGFKPYFTPESEADREAVNAWIRTSGRFDGVIDFDALGRDDADPKHLAPAIDGGDHLHPSAAGYRILADGIDLSLFRPKATR